MGDSLVVLFFFWWDRLSAMSLTPRSEALTLHKLYACVSSNSLSDSSETTSQFICLRSCESLKPAWKCFQRSLLDYLQSGEVLITLVLARGPPVHQGSRGQGAGLSHWSFSSWDWAKNNFIIMTFASQNVALYKDRVLLFFFNGWTK